MAMTSLKLKHLLETRLAHPDYQIMYHHEDETFRIEWKETKQGMTLQLAQIVAKYNERGAIVLDEIENHLREALRIMNQTPRLKGMTQAIYPVIRSTSFPMKTKADTDLVTTDHTAETRIYYALDLGASYQLIDQPMLKREGWSVAYLDDVARSNIYSLSYEYKHDQVAGNDFYFIASQDGYDASRILNESFLEEMKASSQGDLVIAVPHQDVLIIADIRNKMGYDILAQMTMKFFAEGRIPITSLALIYENKTLEPLFILAKNQPDS